MSTNCYNALAPLYDELLFDADYPALVSFYKNIFAQFGKTPIRSIVDLGCGTGKLCALLAAEGYDITGVDASAEMLALAQARTACFPGVLLLEQDITKLDLYDVADVMVSSFDCLNYITSPQALSACFDRVALFLRDNGLFLFDVNTKYKFEHVFAQQSYILQNNTAFCAWENDYIPKTGICHFYLTLFRKTPNGTWERAQEYQKERMYTDRILQRRLKKSGFEILGVYADTSFSKTGPTDERQYYVCRRLPRTQTGARIQKP